MLESLSCNSCGAPIEVPSTASILRCNHCNTSLRVLRTGVETTTEIIDQLAETTERLTEEVKKLTRKDELERLDRQWELQRQTFVFRDQQGGSSLPAQRFAWVIGSSIAFFGSLWTVLAISITRSAPNEGPFAVAKIIFPLFGIGFVAFGIFLAFMMHRKAKQFEEAQSAYLQQRARVLQGDESP